MILIGCDGFVSTFGLVLLCCFVLSSLRGEPWNKGCDNPKCSKVPPPPTKVGSYLWLLPSASAVWEWIAQPHSASDEVSERNLFCQDVFFPGLISPGKNSLDGLPSTGGKS